MKQLLALLLLSIALVGCAPDPVKEAQARQIDSQTHIQETQSAMAATSTAYDMERKEAETTAYTKAVREGQETFSRTFRIGGAFLAIVIIIAIAAMVTSFAISRTRRFQYLANAEQIRMLNSALDITPDSNGFFPIRKDGDNYYDPNRGSVVNPQMTGPVNPQLAQGYSQAQITAIAANAYKGSPTIQLVAKPGRHSLAVWENQTGNR